MRHPHMYLFGLSEVGLLANHFKVLEVFGAAQPHGVNFANPVAGLVKALEMGKTGKTLRGHVVLAPHILTILVSQF